MRSDGNKVPKWIAQLAQVMKTSSDTGRMRRPNARQNSNSRSPQKQAAGKSPWICRRADCRSAQRKLENYGWRTNCFECCRPKQEALSPPLASTVEWALPKEDQSTPKNGKQERRARKESDTATPKAPATESRSVSWSQVVSHDIADEAPSSKKSRWGKIAFEDAEKESIAAIAPAAAMVMESLAAERVPLQREEMTDAAVIFAKLTEAVSPCASVARQSELEAEVSALSAALLTLNEVRDKSIRDPIVSRLEVAREELLKLEKRTPSSAALSSALKEAKSRYERTIQDRKDRAAMGITRSQERKAQRAEMLAQLNAQLNTLQTLISAKESEMAAAFTALNASQDSLEETVLGMFDAKIAAQQAVSMVPASQQCWTAEANKADAGEHTLHLQQATLSIEQQLAHARQQIAQQKKWMLAENDFNATLQLGETAVTAITLASDADKSAASLWYHFATHWAKAGGCEHFRISEVAAHFPDNAADVAPMFRKLIGEEAWYKWSPTNADDKLNAVVPRQLASLALEMLKRLEVDHKQRESIRNAAQSSYGHVTEHNKKRRAAHADAEMLRDISEEY